MTPAPERTQAQRDDALERANEVRTHRAQVKRDVKAGVTRWPAYLDDPLCQTMKVFDLLLAVPKVGRVKVNKILTLCRISPSKTIGGLTDRQRVELITAARGRYVAVEQNTEAPYPTRRRDRAVEEQLQARAAVRLEQRGGRTYTATGTNTR